MVDPIEINNHFSRETLGCEYNRRQLLPLPTCASVPAFKLAVYRGAVQFTKVRLKFGQSKHTDESWVL